jgi:large subunit ribosomal protein L9
MQLILTYKVQGLGEKGDIVNVADGYGRNFLLPRNLAIETTKGAIAHAQALKERRDVAGREARLEAEKIASNLVLSRVVIAASSGDEGKLFGSIGTSDIVNGVLKFTGVELDRKSIMLEKPIKDIGLHEVNVKLHSDVQFTLTLDVIPA